MEGCLLDLAKNEVQGLVNLVKNEAQYLCCFNSYVENFDQKRKILAAKHKDMKREFQKGKGVFSFKCEAQQWEGEAIDVFNIDTKIKKKLFFGWCPNCWWQYRRGRKLAEETQHMEELLGRCNSNMVAGRAHVPDIKSLSRQDFIHFESRKSKFEDLMKALQDENWNMIGLQGMGGAGKTSMAKEVAQKLKESNFIDKFIFLVVSQPPDFKKIRGELAKGLDIPKLEEVKEEELSSIILFKITNMDEKLLIILDDVWEKFDLTENLGIPDEHQHKRCNLLITTRSLRVCSQMGCQMIGLQKLTEEEALDLFEKHATINNSSRGLKGMPQKIVKHCGGVPVAIVAVARALKNQHTSVWKDALKTLEDGGVDPNLEEAYKCLKLSYDNLKNQIAKELFLVSSMFPEDFEIPIKLLIKIGIGLGPFNENDKYHLKRSEVQGAIMELVYSSLLLNGEEESVKIHDLVREVALKIGDKDIQSLVDLKKPIKRNLRYLFLKNDGYPDKFDGDKLELLSIFLDDSHYMNVSDAFFIEMRGLKVLVLFNDDFRRIPSLSLTNSLQPLKDIGTLILMNLQLGDISALENLLSLTTLRFYHCSFNELPSKFLNLNKLMSLEVEECKIEKNNPFEVIERCSQLEELTFVDNECDYKQKNEISKNGSPLTLHRYCISSVNLSNYFKKYGSMSRLFLIDELSHFISDATSKQLVGRAEHLILLGEDAERTWKNLVPDIVPIDEGGILNELIVLYLSSHPSLECLIDTKDHESGVTAFCNLAELHLMEMNVKDLCQGPPPSSFLEQVEIMKLEECHELKRILPNGNCNLCYLKTMKLEDCPKLTSVFQPSTARSLKQLEKLKVRSCDGLEYIVASEDGDSNQETCYDLLFPKLKILKIEGCDKLRIIFPILFAGGLASLEEICIRESGKVEYIFDKFQEGEDAILPSLRELDLIAVPSFIGILREYHQLKSSSMQKPSPQHNSNKINQSPTLRAFSWVQACCSLNRLRPTGDRSLDHENRLKLKASTDGVPPFHTARSLLVQSLKDIKEINLVKCGNIISLSTLSNAASTISLENLIIRKCHNLKCITTYEEDAQVDKNYCSIFPRLGNLGIEDCKELEFLFTSKLSCGLQKLKSLTIKEVPQLKYVVGSYQQDENHSSNQNQNEELHFDLHDLEELKISNAPKINGICTKNYKMVFSSLQKIKIRNCQDKSFTEHNLVNWRTTEEIDASTDGDPSFYVVQILFAQSLKTVREIELVECWNLISLSTLSIATSAMVLENLTISECHKLKCITVNEGVAEADMYCSIFPQLENLIIENCKEVEFLFVSTTSVGLEKLKYLNVKQLPKLKYIVGNYPKEQHSFNHNQIDELHFNLPALKTLYIEYAPKMNSICPKNYKLLLSSPLTVRIRDCDIKSFAAQAIEMQLQTYLKELVVKDSKMKVIFDLAHVDIEKNRDGFEPWTLQELELRNLGELVNLCVGLKPIMCFHSLQMLRIKSCKKLKVIFSAYMVRSLPMLERLLVSECEELVHIVEEDHETNADDHLRHEPCFPNLEYVTVNDCDKLKYLFSVTLSDTLPKVRNLRISKAHELEHVLIRRGEMKEMVMKDVLPKLRWLMLEELPNLISICHGIDFQILADDEYIVKIKDCPNFSFYETSVTKLQTGPENVDFEAKENAEEKLSSHQSSKMGDATQQSLTKKVPIHTSPNLTVLPARDDIQASAKSFEDEEEEQGGLITSRHPRIGMKASSSFSEEKLETSIDETKTTPDDSKNEDFEVWEGTYQKLSSHSNERRALETQQSTTGSSNFTRSNDVEVKPSAINRTDSQKSSSKDELVGKVARNETTMIDAQQSTNGKQNFTKLLVDEEVKKETNMVEPKSQEEITRHDIQSHEEEKPEGDLIVSCTTPIWSEQTSEAILSKSPVSSKASTGLDQTPQATIGKPVDDDDIQVFDKCHVNEEDIKETNVGEDESKANSREHVIVDPSNLKQMEQESSSCSRGQIEHHDVTIKSNFNQALNAGVGQKIVEMLKLEGSETSLLEEAFNTHPQLCLSINDRSKQMLCISYRVLIDILNIIMTRTPFTITEADKRLLEEKLKDACLLGFDKHWLESIRTKAFNCGDISELDDIQETLKGLENDLKRNEAMLEATRNREVEAARVVELAQKDLDAALQEHANVMAEHTHLLKARQHIISKQNHCWEMIAAKNKPLGF